MTAGANSSRHESGTIGPTSMPSATVTCQLHQKKNPTVR